MKDSGVRDLVMLDLWKAHIPLKQNIFICLGGCVCLCSEKYFSHSVLQFLGVFCPLQKDKMEYAGNWVY